MKRKLLFFIMCFLFSTYVNAETFYSDYGEFSDYSEQYLSSNDTTYVEVQRKYKIYKEIYNEGGYYIENQNPSYLPFINKNDYMETQYSSWTKENPENILNRIIEQKMIYEYNNMQKIRYIHLYDFYGSYGVFRISELEVYNGDEKINFTLYCEGCNSNFNNHITNNEIYENRSYITNETGYLRIDLGDYYDLSFITLRTYLFDVGYDVKSFSVNYTKDSAFNSRVYASANLEYYFSYDKCAEIKPFDTDIDDYNVVDPEWQDSIISDSFIEPTKTRKVSNYILYRYKDIKYKYFNYEKEYADGYYVNSNENYPLIDYDNYKDYYRYKVRDKVVINDKLEINFYDFDLKNFILESTIDNINIESNIDYNKNGMYDIVFKLPFKTVQKKVTVFIFDNDYNLLEQKIKELNEQFNKLLMENNLTEAQLNKVLTLQDDNNEKLTIYENKISELNDQILKFKKEIELNSITIEELNSKIDLLNAEKSELNEYIIYLENEIKVLNEKINNDIIVIENLKNELQESLIKQEKLVKDNEKLQILYNKTLSEKQSLISQIDNYEKKMTEMNSLILLSNDKIQKQVLEIEKLSQKNDELNNLIIEYKLIIKQNNLEIEKYEKEDINNKEVISNYKLEMENNKKEIEKYKEIINKNKEIYDKSILEYNDKINNLLNEINLLNEKINNQNNNINELININNVNTNKYKNEIMELQILLDDKKEESLMVSDELNVCLDNEKNSLIEKQNYIEKIKTKNIIVYFIVLLTFGFVIFILKHKKM